MALIAVDANGNWKRTICASMTAGQTQTGTFAGLLDGEDHLEMWLQVNTQYIGETYDNVVLSPQLEAGGTATAFEPYKSILPITGRESVEIAACGKNLLKPPGDATVGGVTYTLQDNGTYLANGTVTGTGLMSLYKAFCLPGSIPYPAARAAYRYRWRCTRLTARISARFARPTEEQRRLVL